MANNCTPQVQACSLRATRLTSDGSPDAGADNLYVSDLLTQLQANPNVRTGDTFETPNACGTLIVNYKAPDVIRWWDITLGLAAPDPELMELIAGGIVLTDGAAVGYGYPLLGAVPNPNGAGIELWAKRITAGALDPTFPYEWYLMPRAYFTHGRRVFENGPITVELTGYAVENPQWLDGPQNDWPVASDRWLQSIPTDVLPDPSCGYATALAS